MSAIDIETTRKLREMGAGDLLAALEAQDDQLTVGLAFGERIRLAVDDAYTAFTDTKVTGLIRRTDCAISMPTCGLWTWSPSAAWTGRSSPSWAPGS